MTPVGAEAKHHPPLSLCNQVQGAEAVPPTPTTTDEDLHPALQLTPRETQ